MKGEKVERVHTYNLFKYLGVHIEDKRTFTDHIHQKYKKCQQTY